MSEFKVGDIVKWSNIITSYDITYTAEKIVDENYLYLKSNLIGSLFRVLPSELCHVEEEKQEEKTNEYKHYKYSYKGIKLDPYRILSVYGVTCPAMQHAIKKLLRAGNSVKDLEQDIQEVIDTLKRKLEMLKEDKGVFIKDSEV